MNNNINVLLDNRNEYVTYLEDTLAIVISEFFYNINLECNSLKKFQNELTLINKWSQKNIDKKMNIINKNIKNEDATPKFMQKLIKEIITISVKLKMYELNIKIIISFVLYVTCAFVTPTSSKSIKIHKIKLI